MVAQVSLLIVMLMLFLILLLIYTALSMSCAHF